MQTTTRSIDEGLLAERAAVGSQVSVAKEVFLGENYIEIINRIRI